MRCIFTLLLVLPFLAKAQNRPVDSVKYYSTRLGKLAVEVFDKLKGSEEYRNAWERLQHHASRSDGYSALALYAEVADADFDVLNKTIVPKGFPEMNGPGWRFGFGFSNKTGRRITDFYFSTFGLNRKSKKDAETIRSNFYSFLHLDFGYDLIKSPGINIFPYAGVGLRGTTISYKRSGQTNSNYTDITDILMNEMETQGSSVKFGYQAGLGFDFLIGTNRMKTSGTMFFIKAGINRPFGKETYKIGGIKYRPEIEYGKWIVTAGFKFFDRK